MSIQCKTKTDQKEELQLIMGAKYHVASQCKWTRKVGTFIGLTKKGWASLDFGKEISIFKRGSLIHEGLVVKREEWPEQKRQVAKERASEKRQKEKMEVDTMVEGNTNELVKIFEKMLYVALDKQQKAFKSEILELRKDS